jgi:hypothetical protein
MRLSEALQELLSQQRPLLTVPDERITIESADRERRVTVADLRPPFSRLKAPRAVLPYDEKIAPSRQRVS